MKYILLIIIEDLVNRPDEKYEKCKTIIPKTNMSITNMNNQIVKASSI